MAPSGSEYLTTRELAELLRIKERKVYDLASSGQVPCSRAMGKLLFPRQAVEAWLAESSSGYAPAASVQGPPVVLGSHDPLLEWALRESRCGLATFFDGSFDGLDRFDRREGVATGLHVFDPATKAWNVPVVQSRFAHQRIVLVEWAWRERGLIVAAKHEKKFAGIKDLKGRRVVPRQPEAGSQGLLEHLLGESGLGPKDVAFAAPARSETDAAVAVHEGAADAAFGLKGVARQYGLGFVPVIKERFDLMVDRRAWFEPPMQALLAFCRSGAFLSRASDHHGYDVAGFGRVHFNGA
ncbi:MAG TPA: helix-turn-helix transcriptional regulator [Rhodospirillales bacterium]|jgi:excisionase family DNA binding protein